MMELRFLDELIAPPGKGVILLSMEKPPAQLPRTGLLLIDALGQTHRVQKVAEQDGLLMFHLPQGDSGYFERLFRNIRVDATLFQLEEEEPCP